MSQVQQRSVEGQVLSNVLNGAATFVRSHKKISGAYLLGLLLVLFGTGFKVSDDLARRYEATLRTVDEHAKQKAFYELRTAEEQYHYHKGWFSCDAQCQRWKMKVDAASAVYQAAVREEELIVQDAKSQVGIFSEYGVQETRDMFWGIFAGGKDFAKRQSMWDMLFMGLRWGRDDNMIEVLLRWLIQLLFNFTLGLCGALVVFWFKLWGLISSYAPNPLVALFYFALAGLSATVCVASYLLGLYGAAAGTVGVVGKAIIDHAHRVEQDPQRRAARMQYQQQQQQWQQQYRQPGAGHYAAPHAHGQPRRQQQHFRSSGTTRSSGLDHID